MRRLLSILLLMLVTGQAGAGVYRWVDQDGRVHFGDKPPPSAESRQLNLPHSASPPSSPTSAAERRERQRRLLDAYREERADKKEARRKQAEQEAKVARECRRLNNRLARYRRSGALYEKLPDGGRRYLTNEERAAEESKLAEVLKKHCE